MVYQIASNRAGVGTMGSGIAALLAGVSVPVMVLDLPARDTSPADGPEQRNTRAVQPGGHAHKPPGAAFARTTSA